MLGQTGRYSPLRYPGGKGKLARFIRMLARENGLADGLYVEPYAGGAAIAWELLITGVVRRVAINDVSAPVHAFWHSVLYQTEDLCRLITDKPLTVEERDRQKEVFRRPNDCDLLELGFSFFFLNRTNRSGILNGGVIGGRNQSGKWKIDARFNKPELVQRIKTIACLESRILIENKDAIDFLKDISSSFDKKTLVYVDPPYFKKGHYLYFDAYRPEDHAKVSESIRNLDNIPWIVSYDDVSPIHSLYADSPWVQYSINYSARIASRGREVMFFNSCLKVPALSPPLFEIDRDISCAARPVSERNFNSELEIQS